MFIKWQGENGLRALPSRHFLLCLVDELLANFMGPLPESENGLQFKLTALTSWSGHKPLWNDIHFRRSFEHNIPHEWLSLSSDDIWGCWEFFENRKIWFKPSNQFYDTWVTPQSGPSLPLQFQSLPLPKGLLYFIFLICFTHANFCDSSHIILPYFTPPQPWSPALHFFIKIAYILEKEF